MSHNRIFIGKNLVKLMASVSKFIVTLPLTAQVNMERKHSQWEISIKW
jgi:hypothetical protein